MPTRALHSVPSAANDRAPYEGVNPHQNPLSPVAQSIELNSIRRSPAEDHHERALPAPPQEDSRAERPSLNVARTRHSWQSGRSLTYEGREDPNRIPAASPHDFTAPSKSLATREFSNPHQEHQRPPTVRDFSNPRPDYRHPQYNHSYYNHNQPYMYSYHGPPPPQSYYEAPPPQPPLDVPPRLNLKHSSSSRRTVRVAPPTPKGPIDMASETETDVEAPVVRKKKKRSHQQPLTWNYDDNATSPAPPQEVIMRLPYTEWMNSGIKEHFVATLAEFVGTVMFLFFAFAGTQVANINASNPSAAAASTTPTTGEFSPTVLTYIALSFGFSLMVNVWIFYRISGGLFNPAVTLGMVMVKSLSYTRGVLLVCAQLTGSIFASLIVKVLFPVNFNVRTTLSPGTSLVQGVFVEALLTAELVFAIFMLAKEKHRATYLAPIGIGIALFVAELVGVYYTGGSLNPARSFGPCVVTGIWDKEHWIYWLGKFRNPILNF